MLGALSVYAVAVAVLATVGSRWRFVSYTCCTGVLSNLARMASFMIFQYHSGEEDPLKSAFLPQTLAWELFVVALPPCALAVLFRIVAFVFFDQEATGMLQTRYQRRMVRFARSGTAYAELSELSDDQQVHEVQGDGLGRETGHHIVDVVLESAEEPEADNHQQHSHRSSEPSSLSDPTSSSWHSESVSGLGSTSNTLANAWAATASSWKCSQI